MKVPSCNSAMAVRNCSCVFMTMGPYQATGSSRGGRKLGESEYLLDRPAR